MNKKEVAQICTKIRKATNTWRNESEDEFFETVGVWYECLKDEPYEMAVEALNEYLRSNTYPPTVADIYRPYKEWQAKQAELRKEYNDIYYTAISYYPCYMDSPDERKEFDRLTGNNIGKARRLSSMIASYVREKEEQHGCMPTLINWLKGIEKIE